MSIGKKRAPRFHVGDPVTFLYGPEKVAAEIVEDRGPLGEYGRRLYRVRINAGQEDESSFEIPEEDIESRDLDANTVETPGLRQEFDITYNRRQRRTSGRRRQSAVTCIEELKRKVPSDTRRDGGRESEKATKTMRWSLCFWSAITRCVTTILECRPGRGRP